MYRLIIPAAAVIVALIVVHGFIPDEFLVDSTTVGLLLLLAAVLTVPHLPVVRRHITELNLLGSGVKFREEADKAAEQASEIAARRQAESGDHERPQDRDQEPPAKAPWPVFVDIDEHLYALIEQDPRLAIIGLGIEVERAVSELARGTGLVKNTKRSVSMAEAVSLLRASSRIDAEEEGLLSQLMRLRQWALVGAQLTRDDARTFFSTVESLNDFNLGFSLNLAPNEKWQEEELACAFEHCIERMPLKSERWEGSCPVFGHDCPGGVSQVDACKTERRVVAHLPGTHDPSFWDRVNSEGG